MFTFALILVIAAWIWSFTGPVVALWDFVNGRFLLAMIILCSSVFAASLMWRDFHPATGLYFGLVTIGLGLEMVKWSVEGLWHSVRNITLRNATSLGRKYQSYAPQEPIITPVVVQIIEPEEVTPDCGMSAVDITSKSRIIK